ncbi:MAG: hypothetical protein Sylvanvirus4_1 [Sylvanvirus sp.]|uniref:Uncharacterized protein n=1 Tax=Sylvanvirus sp. TaxID=2487774 RepID=A0A3G5AHB4_9VIRU|nr:MAG: hypothetical protein Sylvanvirus4_1 [Sylvanvirus sp.]
MNDEDNISNRHSSTEVLAWIRKDMKFLLFFCSLYTPNYHRSYSLQPISILEYSLLTAKNE